MHATLRKTTSDVDIMCNYGYCFWRPCRYTVFGAVPNTRELSFAKEMIYNYTRALTVPHLNGMQTPKFAHFFRGSMAAWLQKPAHFKPQDILHLQMQWARCS